MTNNRQVMYWIIFILIVLLIGGWIYRARNSNGDIAQSPKDSALSADALLSIPHNESNEGEVMMAEKATMIVKTYFNNSNLDPEFSCTKVFPVAREIEKTTAVGRASLTELLKGPTDKEKAEGFFTSLNDDIKFQSLTIENGVARADFDAQLENQVGGSCRVSAIRAQITETLTQFPTVKEVILSIDGKAADILQP